jgi:DNA-binding beta-propeller fold protein YncE
VSSNVRPTRAITWTLLVAFALAALVTAPALARGGPPADVPRGGPPTDMPRGGPPADVPPGPPLGLPSSHPHEVWMLDQGTDLIHVLDEDGTELEVIDVTPDALAGQGFAHVPPGPLTVPHMIEFDSEHRYAFVAATAGQATIVIDAREREVVEVLPTGAGSHMAAVTPDDTAVWVAAIGATDMVEIPLDLDAPSPTFEIGTTLDVGDLLTPVEQANPDWRSNALDADPDADFRYSSYGPVCHQYSPDSSEAWVTLGPGWQQGGLFVLDLETHDVSAAWDPSQVKANCGVGVSPDGQHAVANFSGEVAEGADTEGEWYVFDAVDKELLRTDSSRGLDAHGLRFTPDGERLWQVNRNSDNALIIDATTFEVIREIEDVADAPDILDFSPDGRLVYITQRGPNPRSGAIHAASGERPGVAVVHAASGRTLTVFEPAVVTDDGDEVLNDVHGVAVRDLVR